MIDGKMPVIILEFLLGYIGLFMLIVFIKDKRLMQIIFSILL
jgi:hypothetical protein